MTAQNQTGRIADFFRSEYRKLLGFVRRRIDDLAAREAEDFVHDVAVQLFDRADVTLPIEHLSAYVYRCLQNRIADYFRRRRPMDTFDDQGAEEDGASPFRSIDAGGHMSESEIRRMESSHDLSRLMGDLNEDEKKLIVATEINGQTFKDLSRIWNVPVNTLLSRKSRAMAKMQKQIRK